MTLHATFPSSALRAADAGPAGRTISGTAVPWNVVGTVSDGRRVRFAPGSLPADPAVLPVVLRDHDRARPLGRVSAARDTGAGIDVDTRVSATRDGDEALVLAADGVLGAFSVGADPTRWHQDGDVLVVDAAEWVELSLLTFGAFTGARVTRVAAEGLPDPVPAPAPAGGPVGTGPTEAPAGPPRDPDPDDPDDPDEDDDEGDQPDPEGQIMPTAPAPVPAPPGAPAPVPVAASSPAPVAVPVTAAQPARPPLTLARVAAIVAGASQQGLQASQVQAQLQAALADVTTTDVAGIVQPAYLSEIHGLIVRNRATIDAISSAPLPASGMAIEYPKWDVLPDVELQAAQKTEVSTGPTSISLHSTPVQTWATGNDISLQAVQRSSPTFMDAYLRAASGQYGRKTNRYVIDQLLATAVVVPPGTTPTFMGSMGALIAALDPNLTPPGQLFVGMSFDVGAAMFGVTTNNGPAFWSGSLNLGGGASQDASMSGAGLNLYVDWDLPAKTMFAGSRPAATWYEDPTSPADVRVVDVSLLGVDVGVYGFGALIVEFPKAFAKTTFTVIPVAGDEPAEAATAKAAK